MSEIVVIDPEGRHYTFDADDYSASAGAPVELTKAGQHVATFNAYIGVYRTDAYTGTSFQGVNP